MILNKDIEIENRKKMKTAIVHLESSIEKKSEIETPTGLNYTTPGFDFVCYNSCKDRNHESFCRKQCTTALE